MNKSITFQESQTRIPEEAAISLRSLDRERQGREGEPS